jgi:serine/threonine protein kinase
MPGDDDPTVVGDEDATVQAGGGAGAEDDGTVRAGPAGDDDPTEPGRAAKRPAAPPPKPPPAASGEIGMGTVLKGRFVLEDKLGAGGMGGVFRAVDLVKQEARDRNPHVAVKILNENFADHPDAFIALQRESSRTQRLSHPNIASVYDFDRDGDVAYMVMELLKGDPLDKHLKQNKQGLDADEARSVIKDISSALAYAHAQGLIHSDFKPGNIFFTEDGTAKVFDFGIARAAAAGTDDVIGGAGPVDVSEMDDTSGEDKTLFDAGKLGALTPAYAAIEMFEGRDPGPQDDVYALGIVAYQCLTGKHPFDRQKAPMAEAKGMVPKRPDGVSRREWRAIRHALEFRREDRTPDAQAFLDEFFGITGQALTAALITGLGAAAVVAGLYFGGVIGPQTQINVPEAWVELDTQISNVRSGVQEQLDDPEFSADDQFVAWEGVIQRDIDQWARIASPKLVVEQTFPNEEAAQDFRMQAFEQAGVVLRIQQPTSAGGDYRLVAGPWSGPEAEARRQATRDDLESLGIDYTMISDEAAIAEARDDALDVYLDEFRRRLPQASPPRVGALVQTDEGILRGSPGDERIDQALEAGGFWIPDPEAESEVQEGLLQIRTAETVLSRARENFDLEERSGDVALAERELESTRDAWQQATQRGQQLASTRQREFNVAQQTFEDQQARQAEIEALYNAKVSGGTVDLLYSIEGDQVVESSHPGVYRVFRLQCQDVDLVREALDDFPDLRTEDQRQAVTYAADCMNGKVGNYTESVLRSRDLIVDAARAEGIEASMVAAIDRPDPCGNVGYVGAGRSAFCIDELDAGGAAPPVVVVPGTVRGENYAIGKFEVSIGDWNAFCAATGCERREGPARAPVTGVSPDQAQAYTEWLSAQTGRTYRLPTAAEWRHAAAAEGSSLDPNRNCYSNVRGVIRGEDLVTVGQGAPNAWGLVNHVGNAQELARAEDGLVLVGGRHLDPLTQCTVSTTRGYDGAPDPATGFRVLREIGS